MHRASGGAATAIAGMVRPIYGAARTAEQLLALLSARAFLSCGKHFYDHAMAAICCAEAAVPNKLWPQSCVTFSCGLDRVHRQLVQSNCPDTFLEGYLSVAPARVQAAVLSSLYRIQKRQLPACGCLNSLVTPRVRRDFHF